MTRNNTELFVWLQLLGVRRPGAAFGQAARVGPL
jgi:hypothetical protein